MKYSVGQRVNLIEVDGNPWSGTEVEITEAYGPETVTAMIFGGVPQYAFKVIDESLPQTDDGSEAVEAWMGLASENQLV